MALKEGHTIPPRRASSSWNIPMNSFSNHLNGKIRFKKMGSEGVVIKEEDAKVIWT
jgi:hypothetical protein